MGQRIIAVVHQLFSLRGEHVQRGTEITDPEDVAFVLRHHPEKVAKRMAEVPDEPKAELEASKPSEPVPALPKAAFVSKDD